MPASSSWLDISREEVAETASTQLTPKRFSRNMFIQLLENKFIVTFFVPVIFTFLAALAELVASLVLGAAQKDRGYGIWIMNTDDNDHPYPEYRRAVSIATIQTIPNLREIIPVVRFEFSEFHKVGINLAIGAIAVDVTALLGRSADPVGIGGTLLIHVLFLIGVLLFSMLVTITSPWDLTTRRIMASISIGLGMVAMMFAFYIS